MGGTTPLHPLQLCRDTGYLMLWCTRSLLRFPGWSSMSRILPSQACPDPSPRSSLGSICGSHLPMQKQTLLFIWRDSLDDFASLLSKITSRSLGLQKARRKMSVAGSTLNLRLSSQEKRRKKVQPYAWDRKGKTATLWAKLAHQCLPQAARSLGSRNQKVSLPACTDIH